MTRVAKAVVALLVLVGAGVVVADDIATHGDLGDVRAERDIARRAQRAARVEDEERSLDELDRGLAAEIERQQRETMPGVHPILALPPGVPGCTAGDVELLNAQLDFLLFRNRSGRPCGLLDQPAIEGQDESGTWVAVPVQYVDAVSYDSGPPWTGVLSDGTAVLGIYVEPVDEVLGGCRTGATTKHHFSALRLVLAGAPQRLDLPGVTLDVGPCRPSVRLWAHDVAGGEG